MQRMPLTLMCLLLFGTSAYAQTISIINQYQDTSSLMVETYLKRNLRAEGYTVKGGTNEGIVIILSVMPVKNVSGQNTGVVGHITLAAIGWQEMADMTVSEGCKPEHQFAQKINDYLGARMIYLDETMGTASEEERLGEMFATYANKVARPTVKKMQEFIHEVEKRMTSPSSGVINPLR